MEKNNHTFYHYINSACLAVGVIGSLLYLEVSPLQFGLAGIGLWSVTGILGMKAEKKANKKENQKREICIYKTVTLAIT